MERGSSSRNVLESNRMDGGNNVYRTGSGLDAGKSDRMNDRS